MPVKLGLGALAASAVAGALGYLTWWLARAQLVDALAATLAIAVFGATYLGIMIAAKVPEVRAITRRLRR